MVLLLTEWGEVEWEYALFHFESREVFCFVALSMNGEYMESGSLDKYMNIWLVKEAKIIKAYNGDDGIFEMCWNKESTKVATCFENKKLCVFDIQ